MKTADFDAAMDQIKAIDEERARTKLRDQFAMAALTGLCSDSATLRDYVKRAPGKEEAELSKTAYEIADAMLAAREAG